MGVCFERVIELSSSNLMHLHKFVSNDLVRIHVFNVMESLLFIESLCKVFKLFLRKLVRNTGLSESNVALLVLICLALRFGVFLANVV